MNRQKLILAATALLLIGATAGLIVRSKVNQRLGLPGIRTQPIEGSRNLQLMLPERVLGCTSESREQDKVVLSGLPQDTSFGQRLYTAPDGFQMIINAVLMGSDRTSIHKPEYCLRGWGWTIDRNKTRVDIVKIDRPHAYDLPVMKVLVTKHAVVDGKPGTMRGIYAYWFVAEDRFTPRHSQRMWWMAEEVLRTGVLQRWAYIAAFSVCRPGEEDATFERMKQLLAASVPEFQLVPKPEQKVATTQP